jgi:hypothetical protein
MINRLNLPFDFPTFSLGVSNGANFADLCAAALQFNASGHMTGNGFYDIYANHPDATPVIFVQSENDQHESANPSIVLNNHNALNYRGISSEFHWHKKTPVYSERFIRTIDLLITPIISDSIYQRMVNTPLLLDLENKLLIQDNSGLPENLFTGLGLSSESMTDCENQIKIMNADHKFHSHYNNRIIDFYDLHLANTTSIAPREKGPHLLVYPNPSNGSYLLNESGFVRVYDMMGKLVYGTDIIAGEVIEITNEPAGIYFLQFESNEGNATIKLVRE